MKKLHALFNLITVLLSVLLQPYALADTHTAASCSKADVEAAIAAASNGDTVAIPAGTCDWAGTVSVTNKQLIITGQSNISPDITGKLAISNSSLYPITVKNFLLRGAADTNTGLFHLTGGVANFVVRDMTIIHTAGYAVVISGQTYGVIANNIFGPNSAQSAVIAVQSDSTLNAYGRASGIGTANMVYIDNNTFTKSTGTTEIHGIWSDDGGSYVARYNTLNDYNFDVHGNCTSGGSREWEIYSNTLNVNLGQSWCRLANVRGGTGVIYNNNTHNNTGTADSSCGGINFWEQRVYQSSCGAYGGQPGGTCQAMCDYPVAFQVGRGASQALNPAFVWGNTTDGVSVGAGLWPEDGSTTCEGSSYCNKQLYMVDYIAANRDYYLRAPQSGDWLYPYTAYDYPHPLLGGVDDIPNAPTFLDISGAALSTQYTTSPCATISGIDAGQTPAISISGAGCTYNVDGGTYTSDAGTVGLDNVVCLRGTSSASYSTVYPSCTLTVGGVTDSGAPWTVTTLAAASDPVAPRFRGSSMSGGWR